MFKPPSLNAPVLLNMQSFWWLPFLLLLAAPLQCSAGNIRVSATELEKDKSGSRRLALYEGYTCLMACSKTGFYCGGLDFPLTATVKRPGVVFDQDKTAKYVEDISLSSAPYVYAISTHESTTLDFQSTEIEFHCNANPDLILLFMQVDSAYTAYLKYRVNGEGKDLALPLLRISSSSGMIGLPAFFIVNKVPTSGWRVEVAEAKHDWEKENGVAVVLNDEKRVRSYQIKSIKKLKPAQMLKVAAVVLTAPGFGFNQKVFRNAVVVTSSDKKSITIVTDPFLRKNNFRNSSKGSRASSKSTRGGTGSVRLASVNNVSALSTPKQPRKSSKCFSSTRSLPQLESQSSQMVNDDPGVNSNEPTRGSFSAEIRDITKNIQMLTDDISRENVRDLRKSFEDPRQSPEDPRQSLEESRKETGQSRKKIGQSLKKISMRQTPEKVAADLKTIGVKVVVLDFDGTVTSTQQARGVQLALRYDKPKIAADTAAFIAACQKENLSLWIASFQDTNLGVQPAKSQPKTLSYESKDGESKSKLQIYWPSMAATFKDFLDDERNLKHDDDEVDPIIRGTALVGNSLADFGINKEVKIMTFFPHKPDHKEQRIQDMYGQTKTFHLEKIRENEGVEKNQIVLFDDNKGNVDKAVAQGYLAVHVGTGEGIKFSDKMVVV